MNDGARSGAVIRVFESRSERKDPEVAHCVSWEVYEYVVREEENERDVVGI